MLTLYHPHAKDWFGKTKQFLYRFRDGEKSVELLRWRGTEEEFTRAEQETERAKAEVMALISRLPSAAQRTVMTKWYIDHKRWNQISAEMGMPLQQVKELHNKALPELKRMLGLKPEYFKASLSK